MTADLSLSGEPAAVGLGANLGDREAAIRSAVEAIGRLPGVGLLACSSLYETAPVGVLDQPPFLNAAALLRTTLGPAELLDALHRLERDAGRDRTGSRRHGPRVLDLDLLIHGAHRCAGPPGPTVPHPALAERRFVLVPLAEIAPTLTDPRSGRSVADLLAACPDRSRVVRWS